jgi:hypothetical protein
VGRQLARLLVGAVVAGVLSAMLLALHAGGDGGGTPMAWLGGPPVRVALAQQSGEAMGSALPLRIGRRAITILDAEPETRTLSVFERVEVINDSEAPFVPSVGGSLGPMGLLRFALPRNAYGLTPDPRLGAHEIIQVDRGFGSLLPLAPGTTEINFGYRIPYAGGQYELNTSAVYPTASLWVLVPADFAVDSADLRLDTVADVGRLRYQVMVADGLAAGQRVALTIGGLPFIPRPWVLDETVQRATALALALAGVLGAWVYARRRSGAPAQAPALPAAVPAAQSESAR